MGDYFNSLVSYFFSTSVKIWHKIISLVVVCLLLLLIDGILGFSSFTFTAKKVETIKEITQVLKDSSLDKSVRHRLYRDLIQVSNQKSVRTQFLSLFEKNARPTHSNNNHNKDSELGSKQEDYSLFWLIASSVGFYLTFGLWIIWGKSKTIKGGILDFFIMLATNTLLCILIIALPSFVGEGVTGKYISNVIYQIGIFIVFTSLAVALAYRLKDIRNSN